MIRPGFAHGGLAVFICLLLTACARSAAPAASTTRQQQVINGLTITLEMASQPELNRSNHFVITLHDAQGQFVDDADVYLDLVMTEHPMGSNKPIATAQGAGAYDVEAAYTMSGTWAVTVVAEQGDKIYRATFFTKVE